MKVCESAEALRYFEASASNLSEMTLQQLSRRVDLFTKIHSRKQKFEAEIHGAKLVR